MTLGKELTRGEKLVNWAKAIGLLVGACVTAYGAIRFHGEPRADLAYEELAQKVNSLTLAMERNQSFVDGFLNGTNYKHTETDTAGKLSEKSVFTAPPKKKISSSPVPETKKSDAVAVTKSPMPVSKVAGKMVTKFVPSPVPEEDVRVKSKVEYRQDVQRLMPTTLQQLHDNKGKGD